MQCLLNELYNILGLHECDGKRIWKRSILGGKKNISQKKIPAVSQRLELYIVVLLPVILVKRMIKCPWIAGTRWKTKTEKTHF